MSPQFYPIHLCKKKKKYKITNISTMIFDSQMILINSLIEKEFFQEN